MNRLKLWLSVHDVEVLKESTSNGRVYLSLRLPGGSELPAVFLAETLETNPDSAIHYLELIVEKLAT